MSIISGKNNIVIPLVFAILGVLLVFQFLRARERELSLSGELMPVVVASMDIPAYTKVDKTMFKMTAVPRKFMQPASVQNIDEVDNKLALVPIVKGNQIVSTMLSGSADSMGLAMKIPDGYRAVTVGVDEVNGISGLIKPGNKVDILGTFQFNDNDVLEKRTYTLMEGITVLAVGRNLGPSTIIEAASAAKDAKDMKRRMDQLHMSGGTFSNRTETVTLSVSVNRAQKIILAQSLGQITLALRGTSETGSDVELKPLNGQQMLGIPKPVYIPRPWGEIHGGVRK